MSDELIKRPQRPSRSNQFRELSSSNKELSSSETRSLEDVIDKYRSDVPSCHLMCLSDATGSMSHVWAEVKNTLTEMVRRIEKLGQFKLKWVAYRDYEHGDKLIESSSWENQAPPIINFIGTIECMYGDTWEEAVERALRVAADDKNVTRVLLIGDAAPHKNMDYREQAKRLAELNRPVFSFVVGGDSDAYRTFSEISDITGGACCYLNNVEDLMDVIVLTAAHELGGDKLVLEYLEDNKAQLSSSGRELGNKLLTLSKQEP